MDTVVDWIGRHARLLSILSILLVTANAVFQLYVHKTTALNAWKGGGFGMYTEPHVSARSVWLVVGRADDKILIRLWPEARELRRWRRQLSLKESEPFVRAKRLARQLRYFPRDSTAKPLLDLVSHIDWPGEFANLKGENSDLTELAIRVYENTFDIHTEKVNRVLVYEKHEDL